MISVIYFVFIDSHTDLVHVLCLNCCIQGKNATAIYKLISLVSLSSLCRVGSSHSMQLQLSHIASMIECFITVSYW